MTSEAVLEVKPFASDTLVICFGGNGIPLPPGVFELRRPLEQHPVHKIFLKDLNRAFFLKGIPGISRNVPETRSFLAGYLEKGRYRNVITMGLSAGSHAAIMFGIMLNADRVIGIGARTQITGPLTLSYPQIAELRARGEFDAQYDDLAEFLSRAQNLTTEVHLFFSTDDDVDVAHARQLEGFSNVTLHGAPLGGHGMAIMNMFPGGKLDPHISDLIAR